MRLTILLVMAHHIDFSKGFASFVGTAPAWHQLGTVLPDGITVQDALEKGGLDYWVEKQPNVHRFPNGKEEVSTDSFFLYRTDTDAVLAGSVGRVYKTLQNTEAFTIVDDLVNEGLKIDTAGVLRGGQNTFVSLQAPSFSVKGDEVSQYLLITNPHDGKGAIRVMYTPVRVVCANTLSAALGSKSGTRIRHSINAEAKVRETLEIMGLLSETGQSTQELFEFLVSESVNSKTVQNYAANVLLTAEEKKAVKNGADWEDAVSTRKRNQVAAIAEFTESGIGQNVHSGTAWWMYNGFTGWMRHEWKDVEAQFPSESLTADRMAVEALKMAANPSQIIQLI